MVRLLAPHVAKLVYAPALEAGTGQVCGFESRREDFSVYRRKWPEEQALARIFCNCARLLDLRRAADLVAEPLAVRTGNQFHNPFAIVQLAGVVRELEVAHVPVQVFAADGVVGAL